MEACHREIYNTGGGGGGGDGGVCVGGGASSSNNNIIMTLSDTVKPPIMDPLRYQQICTVDTRHGTD